MYYKVEGPTSKLIALKELTYVWGVFPGIVNMRDTFMKVLG